MSLAGLRCVPRDSVDRLLADWGAVRPELDFSPVGVVARLGRLRRLFETSLEELFAAHGLSGPSFAVLVTLARIDAPGGVSQRRLAHELGLTSGTVSVRMDRLLGQGLVERRSDPADGRNSLMALTPEGRELFERVAPAHLDNERRLLAGLEPSERELLADLLRKLLVGFEGSEPAESATPRLGLTLAPAHVTMAMRRAVGLPDDPGLLVRAVDEAGAAARAGLRPGDVLLRAGGRELRSVADVLAAVDGTARGGELPVEGVRGVAPLTLTLALAPDAAAPPPGPAGRPGLHRL